MLILASASSTRQKLLENAAIPFEVQPARVDEDMVKETLLSEGHSPRNVADALAELKALRIRGPAEAFVLGCDQIADHDGAILSKPRDKAEAEAQLRRLAGGRHKLHSAAVITQDAKPVWRNVSTVTMVMRPVSDDYVADYVDRNWDDIRHSAGSYTLEGEGARFFTQVQGDFFSVLGLPLLPIIDFLATRGLVRT